MDERGVLDLDDDTKTENTRAAYKLEQIANHLPTKRAGHPASVVMLTADAFGVLPPIARLTPRAGALLLPLRLHGEGGGHRDRRHRAAGDVLRVLRRPVPARNRPSVYAELLGERLESHGSTVWLVNTGWTGGPYGQGERMPIARDAVDAPRGALRPARECRVPHGRGLRLRGAREACPVSTRGCSIRAPRGGIPRRTTRRLRSSRGCSWRTSRSSVTRWRPKSPLQRLAADEYR